MIVVLYNSSVNMTSSQKNGTEKMEQKMPFHKPCLSNQPIEWSIKIKDHQLTSYDLKMDSKLLTYYDLNFVYH